MVNKSVSDVEIDIKSTVVGFFNFLNYGLRSFGLFQVLKELFSI